MPLRCKYSYFVTTRGAVYRSSHGPLQGNRSKCRSLQKRWVSYETACKDPRFTAAKRALAKKRKKAYAAKRARTKKRKKAYAYKRLRRRLQQQDSPPEVVATIQPSKLSSADPSPARPKKRLPLLPVQAVAAASPPRPLQLQHEPPPTILASLEPGKIPSSEPTPASAHRQLPYMPMQDVTAGPPLFTPRRKASLLDSAIQKLMLPQLSPLTSVKAKYPFEAPRALVRSMCQTENSSNYSVNLNAITEHVQRGRVTLRYQGKEMQKVSKISEGTYGKVYIYRTESHAYVAVKKFKRTPDRAEIKAIQRIRQKKIDPSVVVAARLLPRSQCIVMHKYHFTVHSLLQRMREQKLLRLKVMRSIVESVARSLRHVWEKANLIYYDMKMSNVLIRCVDYSRSSGPYRLAVTIGDLGGFAKENERVGATFPDWFKSRRKKVIQTCTPTYIAWGCIVLYLRMHNLHIRTGHDTKKHPWPNLYEVYGKVRPQIINGIKDLKEKVKQQHVSIVHIHRSMYYVLKDTLGDELFPPYLEQLARDIFIT